MYTWKCHNETPCTAILNKQKFLFFKNGEQGGKIGPVWEFVPVCVGGYNERVEEGECGANIMYSCMKNETCWNSSRNGEKGNKRE
jgi:hypothetical protein